MPPSRPYDALYDPLYIVSDRREYQITQALGNSRTYERLPRFSNFFSELPTHPSHSLRLRDAHALPEAVLGQTPTSLTRSSMPPRYLLEVKSEGSCTQKRHTIIDKGNTAKPGSPAQKPFPTVYSPTRSRKGLRSPPRAVPAQHQDSNGYKANESILSERTRTKQDFESMLPALSDSKSLSLRKEMLEAWEKAEWSTREAQIQALQEEQLQAFQAEVVAQDGRAEQKIRQRLLSRQRSSGSGGRNGVGTGQAHWTSSQTVSKGHSGGRRGSKGSELTPLEDFVQSNMPLQGRSLFKKISLEPESMLPAAQLSKSQTSTEALLNGGMAKRASSDIAAYRPRVSGTTVRKDMAYTQHLDNVHRALIDEKAAVARQNAINGGWSPPLPAETQPPPSAEQPAAEGNAGGAQVLLLDSRGSTAEGWLTAPDSARDSLEYPSEFAADPLDEVFEQIQTPLLPQATEATPHGSSTPPLDFGISDAAAEEYGLEEAGPEQAAEAMDKNGGALEVSEEVNSVLKSLMEHAEGSEDLQGSAIAAVKEVLGEEEIPGAETAEASELAAVMEDANYSSVDAAQTLQVREEDTEVLMENAPAAETPVDELQAELAVSYDIATWEAGQLVGTDVRAVALGHSEDDSARPATAVTVTVQGLIEEASEDGPNFALHVGDSADSSIEAPKGVEMLGSSEAEVPTLDMLISQRHSKSIVAAAGVGSLLLPEMDDVSVTRPATAVSQTVDELVTELEADFTAASIIPVAAANVQDIGDLTRPAHTLLQEALAAALYDSDDMTVHIADLSLSGTAGITGNSPDITPIIQVATAPAVLHTNAAFLDVNEAPGRSSTDSSRALHFAGNGSNDKETIVAEVVAASFGGEAAEQLLADVGFKASVGDNGSKVFAWEAQEATDEIQDGPVNKAANIGAHLPVQSIYAAVAECIEGLIGYAISANETSGMQNFCK